MPGIVRMQPVFVKVLGLPFLRCSASVNLLDVLFPAKVSKRVSKLNTSLVREVRFSAIKWINFWHGFGFVNVAIINQK